jgi:hypothetical protein
VIWVGLVAAGALWLAWRRPLDLERAGTLLSDASEIAADDLAAVR